MTPDVHVRVICKRESGLCCDGRWCANRTAAPVPERSRLQPEETPHGND